MLSYNSYNLNPFKPNSPRAKSRTMTNIYSKFSVCFKLVDIIIPLLLLWSEKNVTGPQLLKTIIPTLLFTVRTDTDTCGKGMLPSILAK